MQRVLVAVIMAGLVAGLMAACKGDKQRCEVACRNAFTLLFPRVVEAETAKVCGEGLGSDAMAQAASEACQILRKQRLAEFDRKLEHGLPLCLNQCTSANNDDQTACMISAKTAAEVDKCNGD